MEIYGHPPDPHRTICGFVDTHLGTICGHPLDPPRCRWDLWTPTFGGRDLWTPTWGFAHLGDLWTPTWARFVDTHLILPDADDNRVSNLQDLRNSPKFRELITRFPGLYDFKIPALQSGVQSRSDPPISCAGLRRKRPITLHSSNATSRVPQVLCLI